MSRSLQQALEDLYGLERRKHALGLDGTRELMVALGDPHRRFRSVHVAGTNGKGSTCALIERVLRAAGYRTGLYTSPHLVDFRERIRVAGRWVEEGRLEERLAFVRGLPAGGDRTFFEVATALAFDHFAAEGVEVAVVEVGLGGRLDCTNVVVPEVSVITDIDLDHTEILGETIERIAAEKAGIVKPGVPVVEAVGAAGARAVVGETAERQGAFLVAAGERVSRREGSRPDEVAFRTDRWGTVRFSPGPHWPPFHLNAEVALAALDVLVERRGFDVPKEAVFEGCTAARWPGRLERCPEEPRLWWDGAHNAGGVRAMARAWRELALPVPGTIVLAASRDKDVTGMLAELAALGSHRDAGSGVGRAMGPSRLVATRAHNGRAMDPDRVARAAAALCTGGDANGAGSWTVEVAPDVPSACRMALSDATTERPALLLGSLFAVGEAMEAFGGAPGEWM